MAERLGSDNPKPDNYTGSSADFTVKAILHGHITPPLNSDESLSDVQESDNPMD